MSLPKEILKKVKQIEIKTKKLVKSTFAGQYHSAFKGQGMTFADFREYVPGDDVRAISWPLTARTGKTYIKKYEEERELSLILAVDVSGSLNFGSHNQFKGEVAAGLSALLGFAAAQNNDNVGLLLFSDQIEKYVPPKKGRGHIQRLITDLYAFQPKSQGTKISVALEYLRSVIKKRSTLFVISDFMDEAFQQSFRLTAKKHEVVAVVVHDPLEESFPSIGLIDFLDPESGELCTIDTSDATFKKKVSASFKEFSQRRDRELQASQVDRIDVINGPDFFDPLIKYFRSRTR